MPLLANHLFLSFLTDHSFCHFAGEGGRFRFGTGRLGLAWLLTTLPVNKVLLLFRNDSFHTVKIYNVNAVVTCCKNCTFKNQTN